MSCKGFYQGLTGPDRVTYRHMFFCTGLYRDMRVSINRSQICTPEDYNPGLYLNTQAGTLFLQPPKKLE